MRAILILNPASGDKKGRAYCEVAVCHLRLSGWETTVVEAYDRSQIGSAARAAIADHADIIVACGGDGTVGAVAAVVAGSSALFGVLPIGTLNHFARDLGIPLNIQKAARVFTTGHIRHVDVGEVNGLRFINNSSLGIYPSIVRYREAREKIGRGRLLAFAAAISLVFRRFRLLRLRLEIDGKVLRRRTPFLFIGNNRYEIEGLSLGRRNRLDGGKLAVYMSDRTGRIGLLRIAISALLYHLRLNRDFVIILAEKAIVLTHRKHIRVALDGEVVKLHPPLRYSIQPGLLRVIAP